MDGIQLVTERLIQSVLEEARRSPRRRMNHNFHATMADNPHRFLNVMLSGTYIAPHRHLNPPKSESFLVLKGQIAFFLFDDAGRVQEWRVLGRGPREGDGLGIDVAPGLWHTLVVLAEHAICYEVKPGPYSPADDKEFAPWAPREGEPGAEEYLARLVAQVR